jgi:hypothetical protein
MGVVEEGLRHFWLRDIHNIGVMTREGLAPWLVHENFIITSVRDCNDFTIRVLTPADALKGYAYDSTKMASAAFETMLSIDTVKHLPKSTAWILIKAYYAAFFAAHSLLRMFGVSCLQLDTPQINALEHTAAPFGLLPIHGFEAGFYIARWDVTTNEMAFRKPARRGSHEGLWATFANMLRQISNYLLMVSSKFRTLSLQLSEIEQILLQDGAWLSNIRNRANYRHEFGLWHPYSGSQVSAADLVKIVRMWKEQPEKLLSVPQRNPISVHLWVCTIIVAICYTVVSDMEVHAPRHKSFHSYGSLALKRLAG